MPGSFNKFSQPIFQVWRIGMLILGLKRLDNPGLQGYVVLDVTVM